jgi:hypothetical protein
MQLLLKRAILFAAMFVGLVALSLGRTAPAAQAAWSCTPGWRVVKTLPSARFTSVSFVPGTSQAWAVGSYFDEQHNSHPLKLHFDGRRWRQVPSPEPPGQHQGLEAVFARSASDVWAVGSYGTQQDERTRTRIEHWDGSAWSIVPSPNPPLPYGYDSAVLRDVVALAPDDVWAVGDVWQEETTPGMSTLVQHWDGNEWTIVPSPSPGADVNVLNAVARVPGFQTLWSVGFHRDELVNHPLIERYRSGTWTQIAAPAVAGDAVLSDVAALAWDNVWAVGSSGFVDGSALILQRSGTRWGVVPSPPSPLAGTRVALSAVSAVSASDIWAVGHLDRTTEVRGPVLEHWDGSKWSIARSPFTEANGQLTDVTVRRSGWGWSVGHAGNGGGVILRHCPA